MDTSDTRNTPTLCENIESVFSDNDDIYVAHLPRHQLAKVVSAQYRSDVDVTIVYYLAEDVLQESSSDYNITGRLTELVEDGLAEVRVADDNECPAIVSNSEYRSIAYESAFTVRDDEFANDVIHELEKLVGSSDVHHYDALPLETTTKTLAEEFDQQFVDDYNDVLEESLVRGCAVNEVEVAVLVAAMNNELIFDVAQWAEDSGLASKATVSRAKSALEEKGFISTVKVPAEVGRPRQRLVIDEEYASFDRDGLLDKILC